MIEKQETYQQDHDQKAEEQNKSLPYDSSWEKKELKKDIDITKMINKEVTGYDRKEMKSHIDEFSSAKSPREADTCIEAQTNKSRFLIQLSENAGETNQSSFQGKPSQAPIPEASNDTGPGSRHVKEHKASKPRKKRRPQSLNLGMPAELIYRKEDSDSSDEENEGSDSDNTPEKSSRTGNHCEPSLVGLTKGDQGSGKDQPVRVSKDTTQEEITEGGGRDLYPQDAEKVKKKVSPIVSAEFSPGSVNGPGKVEQDGSSAGVKGESVIKVRGKGFIDNKELAEVKLRQVRTHERKISSSGADDMESFLGERGPRTSLHRVSGSFQSEITRIVPLKPERSKSVACKDERDRTAQDEPTRQLRREYRWSVGSPDGPSDLNWSDVSTFHPAFAADPEHTEDSYQSARGPTESQSFGSKISSLSKTAPPAPPVKTQKARESGLILRNSRNVGREPSLDAAKKRHSVTLLGICYSVIGNRASHELQTDLHAIFLLRFQ